MKIELIRPSERTEIHPKSIAELIGYTLLLSKEKPGEKPSGRRRVYLITDDNEKHSTKS